MAAIATHMSGESMNKIEHRLIYIIGVSSQAVSQPAQGQGDSCLSEYAEAGRAGVTSRADAASCHSPPDSCGRNNVVSDRTELADIVGRIVRDVVSAVIDHAGRANITDLGQSLPDFCDDN